MVSDSLHVTPQPQPQPQQQPQPYQKFFRGIPCLQIWRLGNAWRRVCQGSYNRIDTRRSSVFNAERAHCTGDALHQDLLRLLSRSWSSGDNCGKTYWQAEDSEPSQGDAETLCRLKLQLCNIAHGLPPHAAACSEARPSVSPSPHTQEQRSPRVHEERS